MYLRRAARQRRVIYESMDPAFPAGMLDDQTRTVAIECGPEVETLGWAEERMSQEDHDDISCSCYRFKGRGPAQRLAARLASGKKDGFPQTEIHRVVGPTRGEQRLKRAGKIPHHFDERVLVGL